VVARLGWRHAGIWSRRGVSNFRPQEKERLRILVSHPRWPPEAWKNLANYLKATAGAFFRYSPWFVDDPASQPGQCRIRNRFTGRGKPKTKPQKDFALPFWLTQSRPKRGSG